jgi:hypothetical protein
MDQKSAEGTAGFLFLAGFNGAAMQWAIWPVQIWLQWQADVLKAVAPTTTDWMKRRSEGTEAARRALEWLCTCHTMSQRHPRCRTSGSRLLGRLRGGTILLVDKAYDAD